MRDWSLFINSICDKLAENAQNSAENANFENKALSFLLDFINLASFSVLFALNFTEEEVHSRFNILL